MKLIDVSRTVMEQVLGVEKEEEILIITNPGEPLEISLSLFEAAREFEAKPAIIVQSPKGTLDYAERAVIEAIKSEPDIVVSISEKSLEKILTVLILDISEGTIKNIPIFLRNC